MKCIAVFQGKLKNSYCTFNQENSKSSVKINIHVFNLTPGKHGCHIHEKGNLQKTDCSQCGGHWNPKDKTHGGLNDIESHAGDLGNIVANNDGEANTNISTDKLTLFGKNSIIGRSIIIHADEDDLGKGDNKESHITGNAGKRTDCAIIGYA
ncbi:superoxide dismutase family protein [Candidatus Poseidonia alphae]|nr:superoxide dismutase family protein [Candidatus Poseidonia alphae]